MPTPEVGRMWVLGQNYQKRTSSRPEIVLPEVWEGANEAARRKMAADFAPIGRPRAEKRRMRQRVHVPIGEKDEYDYLIKWCQDHLYQKKVPIMPCVAPKGTGILTVLDALHHHHDTTYIQEAIRQDFNMNYLSRS